MSENTELNPELKVTGNAPKGKKPLFVAIIALILVAGLVVAGYFSGLFAPEEKAPHEEMIASMRKVMEYDTVEVLANIKFNMMSDDPQVEMMNEIFDNMSFDITQKFDRKSQRYQLDYNIIYKDQNCGNVALYLDMDKIALQSQFIGKKTVFFEWKDTPELTGKYLKGMQIHMDDYLPLLADKKDGLFPRIQPVIYDIYAEIYVDNITVNNEKVNITLTEDGKEKTIACKELVFNLDSSDGYINESQKYLQTIVGNETIRTLIKEKIGQFIEIAKANGDIDTWPITEEEIKSYQDNLDTTLDMLLADTMAQFEVMETETTSRASHESRIRIDGKGLWRNMLMDQTMQITDPETGRLMTVNTTTEMNLINLGEKLAFIEINSDEAFDAGKASEEDWGLFSQEVTMTAIGQMMLNPLIQDFARTSGMQGLF